MPEPESNEARTDQVENASSKASVVPTASDVLSLSARSGSCPTCGYPAASPAANASPFVYAIGRIEPRFPVPSVEQEFAHVVGSAETKGLTDRQAAHKVLSERANRYLARQLCWVMTIEGLETYILVPRDPADLEL